VSSLNPQIFDKALVETTFTAMYAQFCSDLNKNLPEFEDPDSEDGKMLTFRRILLNKCQARTTSTLPVIPQTILHFQDQHRLTHWSLIAAHFPKRRPKPWS